jgi:hypothetical protein
MRAQVDEIIEIADAFTLVEAYAATASRSHVAGS